MVKAQEVSDFISENSELTKELAKAVFKSARQGKVPVALVAFGVTAGVSTLVTESLGDSVNPDLLDNIFDLF